MSKARSPKRRCPVKECGATISHDYLMCPAHWRLVPQILQREVYAAYDRYLESDRSGPAAQALTDVQNRAIGAVEDFLK